MHSPLHFIDSQDEEEIRPETFESPARPLTSLRSLQGITGSDKGMPVSPDPRQVARLQSSPASSSRRRAKTTPKVRLRHDDSQIQFAAIESSPLQPAAESQDLTTHQKEVKERQGREAAAMFPEISSSPRSNSRATDYVLPKLVLKSSQKPSSESALDENTSPTFLPDALMNDFLGSSPTPSSKRSSERRSDDDPPSSPPFVPFHLPVDQSADPLLARESSALAQAIVPTEEYPAANLAEENMPSRKDDKSHRESVSVLDDDQTSPIDPEDASHLQVPQETLGPDPVSDFDVYVDAPSVPPLDIPPTEPNDKQPSNIAVSFQSQGSSQFSIEDEQITAQLFTEMERASSQQSAKQHEAAQSAHGTTKKRKRTADSSSNQKKIKCTRASLISRSAVQVPSTGETVADCVMIEVREIDRARTMSPRRIKRELSASPSLLGSTEAIEKVPIAERGPANDSMNSISDQSSGQGNATPMTARKAMGRPRGSRNSQVKREESENEHSLSPRKSTRASERLSGSNAVSPHTTPMASQESTQGGKWIAFGKTPRKGMFRWLSLSGDESENAVLSKPTSSATHTKGTEDVGEPSKVPDSQGNEASPADQRLGDQMTRHDENEECVAERCDGEAKDEGRAAGRASAQGIIQNFRDVLEDIKRVTFGREEERAVVGMLFDCIKEVHEAGRRHTDG